MRQTSDLAIARHDAGLVRDGAPCEAIFPRIRARGGGTVEALPAMAGPYERLGGKPVLGRLIRNRFPCLETLNHLRLGLLCRHRDRHADERVTLAKRSEINRIAAGLRNSG